MKAAAGKAAAFSLGGVLCFVGTAFLTVAAWIVLAELASPAVAATVLGCLYLGGGLLLVGFAGRSGASKKTISTPEGELSPMQVMAVAFFEGMEKGAATRSPR